VELIGGRSIRLLPGRDRAELICVRSMLQRALEIPNPEP
jgi:hypothetical protein